VKWAISDALSAPPSIQGSMISNHFDQGPGLARSSCLSSVDRHCPAS
jgi:hypothetical protein